MGLPEEDPEAYARTSSLQVVESYWGRRISTTFVPPFIDPLPRAIRP